MLISTRGGYGFQASSTNNHGVSGITASASKAGVLATHNGPVGSGAALVANGRINSGAWIYNRNTDQAALLAQAIWEEPGKATTAIEAVSISSYGSGVSASGYHGIWADSSGDSAIFATGYQGAVGADIAALGEAGGDEPVAMKVSAISPGQEPFPLGTAIQAAGSVYINGYLSKLSGSFRIDHPLEPANKYLYHSFVESPDMANIYNGTVEANPSGEASVELPEWFGALNKDLRYQLTPVGAPAPDLHVKSEVKDGVFTIAGAKPGQKVCWQVVGTRQDAWANAHRVPVEEDKPAKERGTYLFPHGFGQPETKRLGYRKPSRAR